MISYKQGISNVGLNEVFFEKIEAFADQVEEEGYDVVITSAYREDDPKAHGRGLAVDIRVRGGAMRKVFTYHAIKLFGRVGVYDKHIHVDEDPSRPQNVLWVGQSR